MNLLCHGSLWPVRPQTRRREIEEAGVLDGLRFRHNGVTDSYIDLNMDTGLPESSQQSDPHSTVRILRSDWYGGDRRWVENQGIVFDSERADL